MSNINDLKEQTSVVASVGEFTNAMQQIATIRMMRLRAKVSESRVFVETAHEMLTELTTLRDSLSLEQQLRLERKHSAHEMSGGNGKKAVILITSNQGLIGRYNIEIYQKFERVLLDNKDSDIFVIGKKGQEFFAAGGIKNVHYYPYEVPDTFTAETLQRLVNLFDYYSFVTLVYSHYVNSATREVVALSVTTPTATKDEQAGKLRYIYEPDIVDLINGVSKTLRAALFQQQILDARLAQYSAQMLGMKAATDNAQNLLADLRVEYNKLRRKMIDKKISEVFAGSALW